MKRDGGTGGIFREVQQFRNGSMCMLMVTASAELMLVELVIWAQAARMGASDQSVTSC
jgi:hypothetical protein